MMIDNEFDDDALLAYADQLENYLNVAKRIATDRPLQRSDYDAFLCQLSIQSDSFVALLPSRALRRVKKYLKVVEICGTLMEFFIDQRGRLWRRLRQTIDLRYRKHVERVTGSKLPALVGLSRKTALPADIFRAWTGRLRPNESVVIEDNDDMTYGRRYEKRARLIVCRMFCHFDEPGFFIDMRMLEYGVSPDGVTRQTVTLLLDASEARKIVTLNMPAPVVRVRLGKLVLEIKCSRYGLKEYIQLEHIVQMHLEMKLANVRYSILIYWHQDQVRIWLVEFCESFWLWIARRIEMFLAACNRDDETLNEELETSIAWELQSLWFPDKYAPMRWTPAKHKLCPPERPRTWLLFEECKSRSIERTEEHMDGRYVYPTDRDDDWQWFVDTWKPVCDEQEKGCRNELRIKSIFTSSDKDDDDDDE